MLQLVTLGRLALSDGSTALLPRRRKELVLLALLAWRAPRPASRAELAALLWGTKDEARARQSLRQALTTLRAAVGDALHATADEVRLEPGRVSLDARCFEEALRAGDAAAAVALWQGELLAGAEELGEEELRSWLERERAALRARLAGAFARLVEESRAAGHSAAEIGHALAWSEALPHDETAHQRLVDALRLAGRTTDARARHAAFVSRLQEELGAGPSAALRRLGAELDADAGASRVGARALLTPDLVGRAGVLGRLADAWRRTRAGESVVVLLVGEEGLGKSRLCRELARTVRRSGEPCVVLEGRAFEAERDRAWSTLRGAFPGLAGAPGLVAAPAAALAAVAAISPEVAERFPRLAAAPDAMPAHEGVARALAEVAAEAPLLLVLDDAASADAGSAGVLGALVRRPPPASLLLLTARPESLAGSPLAADLRQAGSHVTEIELHPLAVADVELMAGSMMPLAPECARPLAERLQQETAGNPAQVERLVATWADVGVLTVRADGRWVASRPLDGELPIPADVRESLLDRLQRLSPDARRLADAASVLGGELAPAVLEATAGVPGDRFAAALGELLGRRVLRASARRPGSHELTSEAMRRAVHDALAPSRQRALHLAAARALRTLPAAPDRDARLREHLALGGRRPVPRRWVAAGVLASAVVLLAAGRVVATRSAAAVPPGARVVLADVENATSDATLGRTFYSAAAIGLQDSRHVTLFPRARVRETLARMRRPGADSALTEPLAREVAVREGLASVIVLGVAQVDSSFLLTARVVDPGRGGDLDARSVRVTGRAALLGGLDRLLGLVRRDLGESRRWLRDSAPPLPRITTSSLDALRAFVDGRAAYGRQDFSAAREHLERAVVLDPEFALAHAFLSDVHWFGRSDRPAARASLDRALALRDRLTERERLRVQGQAADRFGDAEDATAWFQLLARRYPDRDTWYILGDHLLRERRCGEALAALRRSVALDPLHQVAHLRIARCLVMEGDAPGALAAYAAAARTDSLALLRGTANHDWGTALVLAGRPDAADSAFRLMLARPTTLDRVRGRRSLAWLAMHRGRYREALAHLAAGVALSRQAGLALPELRDRTLLAEVLAALGEPARAGAQLDTATALAAAGDAPPSSLLAIALAELRLGRRARAHAVAAAIEPAAVTGVRGDDLARRAIEGALLLADGDAARARQVVDAEQGPLHRSQRLAVQAQAFAALGQLDSAMVAARHCAEMFAFGSEEQLEWMRAPLLLAQYAEARGDTATAREAYARVVARWRDADAELADLAAARRGLARLTARRR